MSDTKIVIIYESIRQAAVRDFVSLGFACSVIGLGWFLDSEAMQWVGFVIWLLWMMGRARDVMNSNKKTPQQAADWLKSKFGVSAQ